jgi:hypothetical protein
MNLTKFLGNNERRIEELNEYFRKKEEDAIMGYNDFLEEELGNPSEDHLIWLREKRGEIVTNLWNKLEEYCDLIGEEIYVYDGELIGNYIPNSVKGFLETNAKLVNRFNAELAGKYFYLECLDDFLGLN